MISSQHAEAASDQRKDASSIVRSGGSNGSSNSTSDESTSEASFHDLPASPASPRSGASSSAAPQPVASAPSPATMPAVGAGSGGAAAQGLLPSPASDTPTPFSSSSSSSSSPLTGSASTALAASATSSAVERSASRDSLGRKHVFHGTTAPVLNPWGIVQPRRRATNESTLDLVAATLPGADTNVASADHLLKGGSDDDDDSDPPDSDARRSPFFAPIASGAYRPRRRVGENGPNIPPRSDNGGGNDSNQHPHHNDDDDDDGEVERFDAVLSQAIAASGTGTPPPPPPPPPSEPAVHANTRRRMGVSSISSASSAPSILLPSSALLNVPGASSSSSSVNAALGSPSTGGRRGGVLHIGAGNDSGASANTDGSLWSRRSLQQVGRGPTSPGLSPRVAAPLAPLETPHARSTNGGSGATDDLEPPPSATARRVPSFPSSVSSPPSNGGFGALATPSTSAIHRLGAPSQAALVRSLSHRTITAQSMENDEEVFDAAMAHAYEVNPVFQIMLPANDSHDIHAPREWRFSVALAECRTIGDIKRFVLRRAREADSRVLRATFERSWIRIANSSVVLEDEQPSFLLVAECVPSVEAMREGGGGPPEVPRIVRVFLDPYPQTGGPPEKRATLLKLTTAFQRWHPRIFRLSGGVLTYAKRADDKEWKSISLRSYRVISGETLQLASTASELDLAAASRGSTGHIQGVDGGGVVATGSRAETKLESASSSASLAQSRTQSSAIDVVALQHAQHAQHAHHTFVIETPGRLWELQAPDAATRAEWITELRLLKATMFDKKVEPEDASPASLKNAAQHCARCKTRFRRFAGPTRHVCCKCTFVYCHNCYERSTQMCRDCLTTQRTDAQEVARSSLQQLELRREMAALLGEDPDTFINEPELLARAGISTRATSAPVRRTASHQGSAFGGGGGGGSVHSFEEGDDIADGSDGDEESSSSFGHLRVGVVQAHDLMPSDRNGLSDPYACVFFEGRVFRTRTIPTTLNPVWRQEFAMRTRGLSNVLIVAVFDADRYLNDDFLGLVYIPLTNLSNGQWYDEWYELHPRPGKVGEKDTEVRGSVHLRVQHSYSLLSMLQPVVEAPRPGAAAAADGDDDGGADDSDDERGARGLYGDGRRPGSLEREPRGYYRVQRRPTKLSPAQIAHNLKRATDFVSALHVNSFQTDLKRVLEWRSPARTIGWFLAYLYACLYMPAGLLPFVPPLLLLYAMIANYVSMRFFKRAGLVSEEGKARIPASVLARSGSALATSAGAGKRRKKGDAGAGQSAAARRAHGGAAAESSDPSDESDDDDDLETDDEEALDHDERFDGSTMALATPSRAHRGASRGGAGDAADAVAGLPPGAHSGASAGALAQLLDRRASLRDSPGSSTGAAAASSNSTGVNGSDASASGGGVGLGDTGTGSGAGDAAPQFSSLPAPPRRKILGITFGRLGRRAPDATEAAAAAALGQSPSSNGLLFGWRKQAAAIQRDELIAAVAADCDTVDVSDAQGGGGSGGRAGADAADGGNGGGGGEKEADTIFLKYQRLTAALRGLRDAQNAIGNTVTMLEKFESIIKWRNPERSMLFLQGLVFALIVVALIPPRVLFMLLGCHVFTKHLRKRIEAVRLGVPDIDAFARRDSGNLLVNFISRVPLPFEAEASEEALPPQLRPRRKK